MEAYKLDQLDTLELETGGSEMAIVFSPILETAWYSPGLVVEEDGADLHVTVVRCRLNAECRVTHPIDPAEPRPWTVSLGAPAGGVFLKDADGLHALKD